MPETLRTWSQIVALLSDNETGEISAQDLRDAIYNVSNVYGGLFIRNGAQDLSFLLADSEKKIVNYNAAVDAAGLDADLTNDRIIIPTNGAGTYRLDFGISVQADGLSSIRLDIYKNGSRLIGHFGAPQADLPVDEAKTLASSGFVDLTTSDYLEMWLARSGSGSTTFNIQSAHLVLQKMF